MTVYQRIIYIIPNFGGHASKGYIPALRWVWASAQGQHLGSICETPFSRPRMKRNTQVGPDSGQKQIKRKLPGTAKWQFGNLIWKLDTTGCNKQAADKRENLVGQGGMHTGVIQSYRT